jgi:hypothetical protein
MLHDGQGEIRAAINESQEEVRMEIHVLQSAQSIFEETSANNWEVCWHSSISGFKAGARILTQISSGHEVTGRSHMVGEWAVTCGCLSMSRICKIW